MATQGRQRAGDEADQLRRSDRHDISNIILYVILLATGSRCMVPAKPKSKQPRKPPPRPSG